MGRITILAGVVNCILGIKAYETSAGVGYALVGVCVAGFLVAFVILQVKSGQVHHNGGAASATVTPYGKSSDSEAADEAANEVVEYEDEYVACAVRSESQTLRASILFLS